MKLSLLRASIEEIMSPVNAGATTENVAEAYGKLADLRTDENATVIDPVLTKLEGLKTDLAKEDAEPSSSEEYYESSSSY